MIFLLLCFPSLFCELAVDLGLSGVNKFLSQVD